MMDIGKQVVNWKGDAAKKCYCVDCGSIPMNQDESPAKVNILLHERGLKIVSNLFVDLFPLNET